MFIIILPKENRFLMIGSPVRYTDNRDLFDGNESVQQETLEFCYCSMILQVFSEIFLHTKLDLIQFMLVIPKLLANTSRGVKICMLVLFSHFDKRNAFIKVALVLVFNSVRYLGSEIATQSAANTTQRFSTAQHGGYTEF